MFSTTTIRATLVAMAAAFSLAIPAVAQAQLIGPTHPRPGGIFHAAPVERTPPKAAGSAGIAGYDDNACESLLGDYNTAAADAKDAEKNGDDDADGKVALANNIYKQLTDNCMVQD